MLNNKRKCVIHEITANVHCTSERLAGILIKILTAQKRTSRNGQTNRHIAEHHLHTNQTIYQGYIFDLQNLQYSTTDFEQLVYSKTTYERWTHFTLTWHTKRMVHNLKRTTLTCFNRQTLMIPKASDNKIYSHVTATFQFYSRDFCRKSPRGN